MENQKKEITLGYLFGVLKKSLIVMIIAAVVLGALGAVYAKFLTKPTYRATAGFWINNTTADADYTSTAQTSAASDVASSCVELASTDKPIRAAIKKHGLVEKLGYSSEGECVDAIRKMINAYKEEETSLIFYVSVTSPDPDVSYDVVVAMQDIFPEIIKTLYGFQHDTNRGEFVSVVDEVVDKDRDVDVIVKSPVKTAIIMALIAAVIVYVIYLVISLLDTSIYSEETVRSNFSFPILGSIPTWLTKEELENGVKKKSAKDKRVNNTYDEKLVSPEAPFHVNEAFNSLRTNVIYAAAAAKNPVFVVTGDTAGVGKSIVSSNLSLSIANLSKRVLLVECDMRCPSLAKIFGKKVDTGLSELLAGMAEKTEDVVYKHGDTGLDIVFSGKIPPNPSELLSGFRMSELVEEWKKTYDYIILDMPPLTDITDAAVVSTLATGYILTARCNHSNVNDIKIASERIASANGSVMGVVVNDVNPKVSKNGKYSAYYRQA